MAGKVIFKWRQPVIKGVERKAAQALVVMGTDISNFAGDRAPYLYGGLSNSIRVSKRGDSVIVAAGGIIAPSERGPVLVNYAYEREMGPNRNPSTEHYMEKSFKQVVSGDWQKKYFGGITK